MSTTDPTEEWQEKSVTLEQSYERSVALEQTYVHDVYDQMSALHYPDQRNNTTWTQVKQFLNDLEVGSTVCDVGCGNGRYLNVNPGVFKVGVDVCKRLTQIAREGDKEVLLCDNLELPFKDESFDAVLSIAVIHHFASVERRIWALKELARILRIGGRLVITVWSMEHHHCHKFETQDVLVPWNNPKHFHTPSIEFPDAVSDETVPEPPGSVPIYTNNHHQRPFFYSTDSIRRNDKKERPRLRLFETIRAIKNSPSMPSLSSPNAGCYSAMRKAFQNSIWRSKKKESDDKWWNNRSECSDDNSMIINVQDLQDIPLRDSPDGCDRMSDDDIQCLPIEIRRMETEPHASSSAHKKQKRPSYHDFFARIARRYGSSTDSQDENGGGAPTSGTRLSVASLELPRERPRDSVDRLSLDSLKLRMMRQRTPFCEEKVTAPQDKEKQSTGEEREMVDVKCEEVTAATVTTTTTTTDQGNEETSEIHQDEDEESVLERLERFNVLKQKSLTEEMLSLDRMKEKEELRQNIQKQASLNDDLMFRSQKRIDSLKDSIFSASTAKRFQMFTNKIRNSTTTGLEVSGSSIRSGFAKILQNFTGADADDGSGATTSHETATSRSIRKSSSEDRADFDFSEERRRSHEENSDSSKDNSLQSDTSVDSEDSIISVIERVIAKPVTAVEQPIMSPTKAAAVVLTTSSMPNSPKILSGILSHPTSPKVLQTGPYPAATKGKALSLPASPRTIIMSSGGVKQSSFKMPPVAQLSPGTKVVATTKISSNGTAFICERINGGTSKVQPEQEDIPIIKLSPITTAPGPKIRQQQQHFGGTDMHLLSQKLTLLTQSEQNEPREGICEGDDSEDMDDELQALIPAQPEQLKKEEDVINIESGGSLPRSVYAFVKRSSSSAKDYMIHHSDVPSYEIFNPEFEDIDTDSSGVSTPDSVDSVISVKTEDLENLASEAVKDNTVLQVQSGSNTSVNETHATTEENVSLSGAQGQCSVPDSEKNTKHIREASTSRCIIPISVESFVSPIKHCKPTEKSTAAVEDILESTAKYSPRPQRRKPVAEEAMPTIRDETFRMYRKTSLPERPSLPPIESSSKIRRVSELGQMVPPQKEISQKVSPATSKSPVEEEAWGDECRQYLVEFADNLSERLLAEIDRYKEQNEDIISLPSRETPDPYLTKLSEDLNNVSRLSRELSQDYDLKSDRSQETTMGEHGSPRSDEQETLYEEEEEEEELEEERNRDQNESLDTLVEPLKSDLSTDESPGSVSGWLDSRRNTIESRLSKDTASSEEQTIIEWVKPPEEEPQAEDTTVTVLSDIRQKREVLRKLSKPDVFAEIDLETRSSIESSDTVDMSEKTFSSTESSMSKKEIISTETSSGFSVESDLGDTIDTSKSTESKPDMSTSSNGGSGVSGIKHTSSQGSLRPGESIESSDIGDMSERTGSISDFSRQNTLSRSVITQSSASLASWSECSKDIRFADRRMARCDGRSSSEETNPPARIPMLIRQQAAIKMPSEIKTDTSSSQSTSQDSLTSESGEGGGSFTFHRYYHVFKEGELDKLIEDYVGNLHIINSYCDQSNWCIVAEKVRVWTI